MQGEINDCYGGSILHVICLYRSLRLCWHLGGFAENRKELMLNNQNGKSFFTRSTFTQAPRIRYCVLGVILRHDGAVRWESVLFVWVFESTYCILAMCASGLWLHEERP